MTIESVEIIARATHRVGTTPPYTGPALETSVLMVPTSDDQETPFRLDSLSGLDFGELNSMIQQANPAYPLQNSRPYAIRYTPGPREIVILLGLRPRYPLGETIQSLRDHIYRKLLMSPVGILQLKLNMADGLGSRMLEVEVKKVEANISVATNQVQITLRAKRGILMGPRETFDDELSLGGTGRLFTVKDDISTAPHGIDLEILCAATLAQFDMTNNVTGDRFMVVPAANLPVKAWFAGDVLNINSIDGEKAVTLKRAGVTYNLGSGILPYSRWPVVHPGVETSFSSSISSFTVINKNKIKYSHAYWGV